MMKKILLVGALFIMGYSQARIVQISYQDNQQNLGARCELDENNQTSIQAEYGLIIVVEDVHMLPDETLSITTLVSKNGRTIMHPTLIIAPGQTGEVKLSAPEEFYLLRLGIE